MNELETLLTELPLEIKFSEVKEIDQLDERISAVGTLFANTIGMLEDGIEFCPDEEPPEVEESLSWVWAYRPDLGYLIEEKDISDEFRKLIKSYRRGKMDEFWNSNS